MDNIFKEPLHGLNKKFTQKKGVRHQSVPDTLFLLNLLDPILDCISERFGLSRNEVN
jgi:hypothetical protein